MAGERIARNLALGIKNLMLHKLRSFLTVLGVVFGVSSVIAMLAVSEGASQQTLAQIERLGSRNIFIHSTKPLEDGQLGGRTNDYGLRYEDARHLEDAFSGARRVVPVKTVRTEARNGERKLELRVVGTTPAWFALVRRSVIAGRPLLARDLSTRSNAVVLTEDAARRLLGGGPVVGASLRIGSDYFEVVGVVRSASAVGGGPQMPDEALDGYVAIDTVRERFGDRIGHRSSPRVELQQMIVEARRLQDVEPLGRAIETMLGRSHASKDYRVDVPLALLRQARATTRTFNLVFGSIAGISLLVGGIGIMNIMLASVTERTREIGIRRAIGAKRAQIVGQFLIETVVLSMVGGLIGTGVGVLIPKLISFVAGMPTVVSVHSVVLAVGISVAVGIVFGLYPAVRAARLDPIAALRLQ